jgi:OmpA-OmpF porin, OOP family
MIKIFKSRTCLTGIFLLFTVGAIAQDTAGTVRPFTGSKGFRKFSIGFNAGVAFPAVATGGHNDFTNPKVQLGYGANVKYQATHWLAFQADVFRMQLKADNTEPLGNGQPAIRPNDEFTTQINWGFDAMTIFSPGNINWLSRRTKIAPYIGGGVGLIDFQPEIRRRGTNNFVRYNPNDNITEYIVTGVAGLKINIARSLNLDLGYKAFYMDGDNLDGSRFNPPTQDKFSYGFVGLDFVLGPKSKPQLMFNNPAAAMSDDINNQITELRAMIDMADTDGDGVPDKFDKEPNTPINCPVDTKGISRDTDGDGVADCRDKELITPTTCQPVNADGVGKCPDPACCNDRPVDPVDKACKAGDLPSITFRANNATLSADARAMLATVGAKLRANPNCVIRVQGYASTSKATQRICNQRNTAIMTYLSQNESITADRVTVNCQVGGGDINTVDIVATDR